MSKNLSKNNLKQILGAINALIDWGQISKIKNGIQKIPFSYFEKNGLNKSEVKEILNYIIKKNKLPFKIINQEIENGYKIEHGMFEDSPKLTLAIKNLNKLNIEIEDLKNYIILKTQVNNLSEYLKQSQKIIKSEIIQLPQPKKGKITDIEFLKENLQIVYVNKNYNEFFKRKHSVSKNSFWRVLINLAENKYEPYEKNINGYFNSSSENPLYKTLGYKKTIILEKNKDKSFKKKVPISIISQEKINRREAQKKKG